MTDVALRSPALSYSRPAIFTAVIFTSAALVFTVEPMVAAMILPFLGGSSAVWNTSVAFFQMALLVGYGYAHLLVRLPWPRAQVACHLCMLAMASLFLPIRPTSLFGEPVVGEPVLWLMGVLIVSVGAPFAVLSSTAPLLQAWYARSRREDGGVANPYPLYAASNIGSLLALVLYPTVVQPALTLSRQSFMWEAGYLVLCALTLAAGLFTLDKSASLPARTNAVVDQIGGAVTWPTRVVWVLLAAAPSSLMLGAATYISSDVVSAPLFWVAPLALYLLTFIIAFQVRPAIESDRALRWQAICVALAASLFCINSTSLVGHLAAFLGAFFFSALVCHQRLAATKPHPSRLTEFYFLISLGGVLGGMFNAFVAPNVFRTAAEFPLVLALCCLARPALADGFDRRSAAVAASALLLVAALVLSPTGPHLQYVLIALALAAGLMALLVAGRAAPFTLIIGSLCCLGAFGSVDRRPTLFTTRSFFGVHRVTLENDKGLGGRIHVLFNGATIHGAQAQSPALRCLPTTYYSPPGPFGQVYRALLATHPSADIGVVGLGAGTVAAYSAAGTHMRFFEIDPAVKQIALDPKYFTYLSDCAKGSVDVVLGDARLRIAKARAASFDLLQIDAFTADNVPTHLLTTQAFEIYFRALKRDGLLMLHLSNRNMSLEPTAAAAAAAVGAFALTQDFKPQAGAQGLAVTPTQVMVVSKSQEALAAYEHDGRWRPANPDGVSAWTDSYTNVIGPLIRHAIGSGGF
jgi:hypothetical protein